jgi:hypothetical protein
MTAPDDYLAKAERELSAITREMKRTGNPGPLGNPLSGTVIVLSQPVGPRVLDAIRRSLDATQLDAYVTYAATGLLRRELLLAEPSVLAASGPEAAAEVDALQHPLASKPFAEATEGAPFAWKRNTTGILLPSLAGSLDDEAEKRRFWQAFLTLRSLR